MPVGDVHQENWESYYENGNRFFLSALGTMRSWSKPTSDEGRGFSQTDCSRKNVEPGSDPEFKPTMMNTQDVAVELYGDTAIVVGVYHAKGSYKGKSYEHVGRFTDTWIRQGKQWVCVASHTSLLPKQN